MNYNFTEGSDKMYVRWALASFALTIILLIVFANPFHFYFLNDDFIHIPMAKDGYIGHHNSLRHINDLSLYLDYLWAGKNAWGYHLTNLLLHIANMFMAVKILITLHQTISGNQAHRAFAVFAVALFGVYAFHSEAVFWILCRTASLSLFFNLLSWLCFFKALQNRFWLLPYIAFFLLGIFTYESLWVFPFWLIAWFFLLPKASILRQQAKLPIALLWLFFIAYFPFRLIKTGALLGSYEASDVEHFNIKALAGKTAKLFFRSFLPPMENTKMMLVCAAVVAVCILVAAVVLIKRKKVDKFIMFLVVSWLLSYFPYVSLGVSSTGYESERYLYYPSLFLCATMVYAGLLLFQKPLARIIFGTLLFAFHVFFFVRSAGHFKEVGKSAMDGIEAIKQVPLQKKIVVVDLPAYIRGVPVFNYGFMNGVEWLATGRDSLDVQVLSNKSYGQGPLLIDVHRGNPLADTIIFSAIVK
jgi:hypothetical protein